MAFHTACPITCQKICFCTLGLPLTNKEKNDFLDDVARVEELLKNPLDFWVKKEGDTVKVAVPKVIPVEEDKHSAQIKRKELHKKAATVARDFAPRVVAVDVSDDSEDNADEDLGQSNVKVMCRLCFAGENEGSHKARKMLPCKSCGMKYHRNCVETWSQHRDLFNWSSWNCPSCRSCEACKRTGDQTKFKFCRRCDGAYHSYCQQPPHKNANSGPYVCPKHARCYSCASTVPGNGSSVRWFLGYTCCDACGRLFVKGNYCPVCLKVYRDTEPTPMVCCDVCQRWVHLHCDGISDERYMQFQADGNLPYKCPTCRGDCYQVRNQEDAIQELWRRKDEAEHDLIASLRAAAGLPAEDDIYSISPDSDDEENAAITSRNEYGRSLKFSVKGLADKSPKKNKEHRKKHSNTKNANTICDDASISKSEAHQSFEGDMHSLKREGTFSSPSTDLISEGLCSFNQAGVMKRKYIDEVTADNQNKKPRTIQTKSSTSRGFGSGNGSGTEAGKPAITNKKLVIRIGGRNVNVTSSSKYEPSSNLTEQELTTRNGVGIEEAAEEQINRRQRMARHGKLGDNIDLSDQLKGTRSKGKEINLRIKRSSQELSATKPKFVGGNVAALTETVSQATRSEKEYLRTSVDVRSDLSMEANIGSFTTPWPTQASNKDAKPSLKLKFKTSFLENPSYGAPQPHWSLSVKGFSVKGPRSKKNRPSGLMDQAPTFEDGRGLPRSGENNWFLQNLGEDAIGKRVEVHQPYDDTWHKGMVEDIEGTSTVTIALDDGTTKHFELGKQGIRFVLQKQKQSATRG